MTQAKTLHPSKGAPRTLTDTFIATLEANSVGRFEVRDGQLNALALLIGAKSRTWYVRATLARRTHRVRLGPWPIVPADEARQQCLEVLRKLYRGEQVKSTKPTETIKLSGPTLADVLTAYLGARTLTKKVSSSLTFAVHKQCAWSDRVIDSLTPEDVAQHYRAMAAKGLASANKWLAAVSALDRYAHAAYGAGSGSLVARARILLGGVDSGAARTVTIGADQLPIFWTALKAEAPEVRRYVLALLLSGCRANELRNMAPDSWSAAAGLIQIPTTKNGKPHTVAAGVVLRGILETEAAAPGVLVRKDGSREATLFGVPVKVYTAAVERIGKAIGTDFHLHDLRRTFATEATVAGVDEGTLKALMNHSTAGNVTAKHYVQRQHEQLRQAMQTIEGHFFKLFNATEELDAVKGAA